MYRLKRDPKQLFARDTHPELPIDPDVVQPGVYKWPPHFTPTFLTLVFLGGCFGAAARYWVSLQLPTPESGLPVATLFVNLLGAFLLGLLLEGLVRLGSDDGIRRTARLSLGTGFMGAFTTYSTFVVEAYLLLHHGQSAVALMYMTLTVVGGVVVSSLGIQVAAIHHKKRESQQ